MTSWQVHVTLCSRYVYNIWLTSSSAEATFWRSLSPQAQWIHCCSDAYRTEKRRSGQRQRERRTEETETEEDEKIKAQARFPLYHTQIYFVVEKYSVTHSSAVYWGMWSGILVSFWLEQSTVVPSQRHFSGQAKSAKQSPPSLLR